MESERSVLRKDYERLLANISRGEIAALYRQLKMPKTKIAKKLGLSVGRLNTLLWNRDVALWHIDNKANDLARTDIHWPYEDPLPVRKL